MCLGIPGKIVAIVDETEQLGLVDVGGIQRQVILSCVAPAEAGLDTLIESWVLVHVGFAMSVLNADEAAATLRVLTELGEMQQERAAMQQGAR